MAELLYEGKAKQVYKTDKEDEYLKLVQQNKYIYLQQLPLDNYYDATMITMIALELF